MAAARATNRNMVLACVLLAMFMAAIEATIVATAMPNIVGRLGGFSLYSWVFAGFLLTQSATTVMFGKMSDLYGRRPVLIFGIILFLIGSLLCGLAWSMPSLILFRLIQGLGAGSIQPVTVTIVGDLYTPEERAGIQGYLSSVWGVSAIVGPLVGGLIVERFSWSWIFWMNIPLGIATIAGLSLFLHEGVERKKHKIDFLGAALFTIAISSLLILLTQGFDNRQLAIGMIALFLISVPLFLWQEKRAPEPMLALDIWTDRLVASANGASMAAGMTLMGITAYLAVYVQGVMGRSATVAGLTLTMMAVGWPIASMLSRKFYEWIGMRATVRFGSFLMIVGSVLLLFLRPDSSPVHAGAGSAIIGFGMGLLVVTCILLIQGSVPWAKRGSATAANVFARILGSTLGAAVMGSVLIASLRSERGVSANISPEEITRLLSESGARPESNAALRAALDHGLHLTFWCMVALAVLTFVLSWFIPARDLSKLAGGDRPGEAAAH